MSDIVGFITARLDEDEAVARAANPGPWRRFTDKPHLSPHAIFGGRWPGDMVKLRNVCTIDISWQPAENADHITRHNPARVLADIAAKRAIIAAYLRTDADDPEDCFAHYALEDALRELAAVHGDHPDYDPSWRPA